jgi:plastocyanin
MRRVLLALASLAALPVAFAFSACAGDDPAAPGPKPLSDAAVPETAPADTSTADTGETGTGVVVGGCSQADFAAPAGANGGDLTGQAAVEITFPTGAAPAQYGNRCPRVKAGTVVTFKGSFFNHPLQPNGGDTPTPIVLQNSDPDGGSLAVTMPAKGTYGYECMFHPSLMFGAIQVVP